MNSAKYTYVAYRPEMPKVLPLGQKYRKDLNTNKLVREETTITCRLPISREEIQSLDLIHPRTATQLDSLFLFKKIQGARRNIEINIVDDYVDQILQSDVGNDYEPARPDEKVVIVKCPLQALKKALLSALLVLNRQHT